MRAFFAPIRLSIYLSYLSYLSYLCYLSLSVISVLSVHLTPCQSVILFAYPCVHLSFFISIYLSVYLSISLVAYFQCLFIYVSYFPSSLVIQPILYICQFLICFVFLYSCLLLTGGGGIFLIFCCNYCN